MEGARISWDELTCIGYPVTEDAVQKLCSDIMNYRQQAEAAPRNVTKTQLVNWKLLKEIHGSTTVSNAFVLPVEAIREMIINAHCHRSLTEASYVQVAIYDDRLEVTSPGGLYNGLTYEELMSGHSRLRNRTIANVLGQMGLVESWGTGIKRIMKAAEDYSLPVPEFQTFDNMFRVNLFRPLSPGNCTPSEKHRRSIGETSVKHRRSIGEASEKIVINKEELNVTQRKMAIGKS